MTMETATVDERLQQLVDLAIAYARLDLFEIGSTIFWLVLLAAGAWIFVLFPFIWTFLLIRGGGNDEDEEMFQRSGFWTGFLIVAIPLGYWGVQAGHGSLSKPVDELTSYEKTYGVVAAEVGFVWTLPAYLWNAVFPDEQRTARVNEQRVRHAALFWRVWAGLAWRDWWAIPLTLAWWALRASLLGSIFCCYSIGKQAGRDIAQP
jgi:hypothetical protein